MPNPDAAPSPPKPIEVFYAYSHKDENLRDKLETHLSILQRNGIISGWHDRRISAGMGWTGIIDDHLNGADIILLLVSADFVASNYCYDKEMRRAMERHEAGEARVIPVILRPCDWEGAPFGKLQGLPRDMKPVTSWINRDEAFKDVVRGIREVAEELRQSSPKASIASDIVRRAAREGPAEKAHVRTSQARSGLHRVKWQPGSSTLLSQGPHIEILIASTAAGLRERQPAESEPRELPVRALIDTGASLTVINPQIAATCNLQQTGRLMINALGGGVSDYPAYTAAISFPGTDLPRFDAIQVVACSIIHQPYVSCIIGRDILRNWLLKYDGRSGEIEIVV